MSTLAELKDELFYCCKTGDVDRLRFLVTEVGLNVNVHDEWQASPLYYASLCGHLEAVVFLLTAGARCQESTFDGERCVYAALNDQIRRVLRQFKTTRARDPWSVFLRKCHQSPHATHADVTFLVHGVSHYAHRVILCARCPYFHEEFLGRWQGLSVIQLSHSRLTSDAFGALLRFLYTERLELHVADVPAFLALCKQCRCLELADLVRSLEERSNGELLLYDDCGDNRAVAHDLAAVASESIGFAVDHLGEDTEKEQGSWSSGDTPPELLFPDVCVRVQGHPFLCHQVFLRGRSEYLNALFTGPFNDCADASATADGIPRVDLEDCEVDVFKYLIEFLYTNRCSLGGGDDFYRLFRQADIFLIPELKNYCVQQAQQFLNDENVFETYKFARLVESFRLEDECVAYIAANLSTLGHTAEFRDLVIESCQSIRERQEVDTCPLVDDIRSHLVNQFPEEEWEAPPASKSLGLPKRAEAIRDTHRKHAILESILRDLNLEL